MLLCVAVDPQSVAQASRPARDCLVELILKYGVLAIEADQVRALQEHLALAAPGDWPSWLEAIRSVPTWNSGLNLADLTTTDLGCLAGLPTIYLGRGEIVRPWLDDLGDSEGRGCALGPSGDFEVVEIESLLRSELRRRHERWANSVLPANTSREIVWEHLRPLAKCASPLGISVIDRYLLENAVKALDGKVRPNGTGWLITSIARDVDPESLSLSLYGRLPDPPWDTAAQLEELAQGLWEIGRPALRELRLIPVRGDMFNNLVHGRSVRFAGRRISRTIGIDHSMSVFDNELLSHPLGFTYRTQTPEEATGARTLEAKLEEIASRGVGVLVRDCPVNGVTGLA